MIRLALMAMLADVVVVAASSAGAWTLADEAQAFMAVDTRLDSHGLGIYLDHDGSGPEQLRMYVANIGASTGERRVLVFDSLRDQFELDDPYGICHVQRQLGSDGGSWPFRLVCSAQNAWKVQIEGSEGNDEFCVIEPLNKEFDVFVDAHGHRGDDAISGGSAGDELNGEGGNDTLIGYGGADLLSGFQFAADDEALAAQGIVLRPSRDNDLLFGMDGPDAIYGGPGADWIVGGEDADVMLCGTDGFWNGDTYPAVTASVLFCNDRWQRDQGDNRIFAAEALDRDPITGSPLQLSPRADNVDCGSSTTSNPNLVSYDQGLDVLSKCPTKAAPQQNPPQLSEPHPLAPGASSAHCPKPRQP